MTVISSYKMNYYYFICVEKNNSSNFSMMFVQHNAFNKFTLKKYRKEYNTINHNLAF